MREHQLRHVNTLSLTGQHFLRGGSPCDTLESEPIILGIEQPARNIRTLHPIIEERIRQQLRVELGMIWRTVEDDVANPAYFIAFVELESLTDEQERFLSGEECLSCPGDLLVR